MLYCVSSDGDLFVHALTSDGVVLTPDIEEAIIFESNVIATWFCVLLDEFSDKYFRVLSVE